MPSIMHLWYNYGTIDWEMSNILTISEIFLCLASVMSFCHKSPNLYLHWFTRCQNISDIGLDIFMSRYSGTTYHHLYILLFNDFWHISVYCCDHDWIFFLKLFLFLFLLFSVKEWRINFCCFFFLFSGKCIKILSRLNFF